MKNPGVNFLVFVLVNVFSAFAQTNNPVLEIDMVPMITINSHLGAKYEVQYISELNQTNSWKYLETVSVTEQPMYYFDTSAVGQQRRYYRLEEIPVPPGTLNVNLTNDNQDQIVVVDENSDTDGVGTYFLNFEAIGTNVTVQNVTVFFENGDTTTSGLNDMIGVVHLYFDGDQVGSESFTSATTIVDSVSYVINEGNTVAMLIAVDINRQGGRYENGSSFFVSGVLVDYVDVYGNVGSINVASQGGLITLDTVPVITEIVSTRAIYVGTDESRGIFEIGFKATSFNDDVFIPEAASTGEIEVGVTYEIINESNEVVVISNTAVLEMMSGGDITQGYIIIPDSQTASFRLSVLIDNQSSPQQQTLGVRLKSINCRIGSTTSPVRVFSYGIGQDSRTNFLTLSTSVSPP